MTLFGVVLILMMVSYVLYHFGAQRPAPHDANPAVTEALRIVVKSTLGWVSFFAVPFTVRNRALHDMAARSVVIRLTPQPALERDVSGR